MSGRVAKQQLAALLEPSASDSQYHLDNGKLGPKPQSRPVKRQNKSGSVKKTKLNKDKNVSAYERNLKYLQHTKKAEEARLEHMQQALKALQGKKK